MQRIKIVGTRKVDFTNPQGQKIEGHTIFALYKDNSPYVVGDAVLHKKSGNGNTFKFPFVSKSVLSDIPLGEYDMDTDFQSGNIIGLKFVK